MTFSGFRCDGCTKEVSDGPGSSAGWIGVERRGELLSISTSLYTCETYKHFCPECAEKGIKL